jgi:hypothetical protein
MSEKIRQLEERMARLETELREVKCALVKEKGEPWWKRTAGMFKDDPLFDDMVREMNKARREDLAAVNAEIDALEAAEAKQRAAEPKRQAPRKRPAKRKGVR